MKYYAVKKGLIPGIYNSWSECEQNVKGVSGAQFKSFNNYEDAKMYLNEDFNIKKENNNTFISNNLDTLELNNFEDDELPWKEPENNKNEMKKLNVTVQCLAIYNSSIDVPKNMSIDEAIKYAKEHINEIPNGTLQYIQDSDELDEENCDFDER